MSFLSSAFNTISSKGYLDFLPKKPEYLQIHSLNLNAISGMQKHERMRSQEEPIRVGFIGYVRFLERNKHLLKVFKNDERFELCYFGKGAEELEKCAADNGITNTLFHGGFPVSDTAKFLEQIDIINNLYGNNSINLRKAISIKFYHALFSRIPILVCPDTYVGKLATDVGIGFIISDEEINESIPDRMYTWYRSLDFDKINNSCEKYLENVYRENKKLESLLKEHL